MMSPAYVECDDFRVVHDDVLGVYGNRVRHRIYRLRAQPDQRAPDTIELTAIKVWALAGSPADAVFHLGNFHRMTVV